MIRKEQDDLDPLLPDDSEELDPDDLELTASAPESEPEDDEWLYPEDFGPERLVRGQRNDTNLPDLAEPPEPPRRVVELGPNHLAIFEGPPRRTLFVYKIEADTPLELPYFDPSEYSEEALVKKLKTYTWCA